MQHPDRAVKLNGHLGETTANARGIGVPTHWLYGENDSYFGRELATSGIGLEANGGRAECICCALPAARTLLSICSCKATLIVITGLSLMGIILPINLHARAVVIVALALVAVFWSRSGYRRQPGTFP